MVIGANYGNHELPLVAARSRTSAAIFGVAYEKSRRTYSKIDRCWQSTFALPSKANIPERRRHVRKVAACRHRSPVRDKSSVAFERQPVFP